MKKGKVTRPPYGDGDAVVMLTATITKGSVTKTKQYRATVKQAGMSDTQAVAADMAWLSIANKDAIKNDILLPVIGPNGSTITWKSDKTDIVSKTGTVVRPANGEAAATVNLTATVSKGAIKEDKAIAVKVLPWTDTEEIRADFEWLTFDVIKGNNTEVNQIKYNLVLPKTGDRDTTITWSSSNPSILDPETGTLSQPAFTMGDVPFVLTAVISKGSGASKTRNFANLVALKAPITNDEAAVRALNLVDETAIKGPNPDVNNMTQDTTLPKFIDQVIAPECATVSLSWVLLDASTSQPLPDTYQYVRLVEQSNGILLDITRPASGQSNTKVKLEVTATSDKAAGDAMLRKKSFLLTIVANA